MSRYRKIFNKIFAGLFLFALVSFSNDVLAQNGEALFKANCASCHKPIGQLTGPALQGIRKTLPPGDWVYKWIANSSIMNDAEAMRVKAAFGNSQMQAFGSQLKKEEIDAILDYADKYTPPVPVTKVGGGGEDNSLVFGILTLILALIAFTLLQVNSNLRKLSDEKEGVHRPEPVPTYKNKTYLMAAILVLFAVGGYYTINGAIGLGRMKNYQPEQPIYYSHQVHAGTNQISCLYCHGGAQDSKHANIPSVNICMNCHMAINEYAGKDKLYKEDGTEVNGTHEIEKLYKYAGFNPKVSKIWDASKATPIKWAKVHNLPDHVYFNHSQHVKAGKVQCQTCHGEVQKMGVAYQYADLSMGWCVNCHRNSQVQFKDNGFYSIYQKFHDDLKSGRLDSTKGITVEKIGGTECAKCHY